MSSQLLKAKIKALEGRLAILLEEHAAVNAQISTTLDASQKVKLKEKLKDIEQESAEVESELQEAQTKFKLQNGGAGNLHISWQENLPRIDYKKARAIAQSIFTLLEDREGGVLFLLQNSNPMGGDWCLQAIRNMLDKSNGKFRRVPVEFLPGDSHDEQQLISKLKERFNADMETTVGIIETLCKSLKSGNTIFIEIIITDSNALEEKLLPWFIEQFWCPLVDKLSSIAPLARRAKCVTTIVAPSALSADAIESFLCCAIGEFDQKKILELPLEKWTESDIEGWLIDYSGLSLDSGKYKTLASYIYSTSDCGLPSSAHSILMKTLRKYHGGQND